MTRLSLTILAAVLLAAVPGSGAHADSLRNVRPGEPIPAFSAKTMDGTVIESAALRGKAVVLVFLSAEQRSSEAAAADAHAVARDLRREDVTLLYVTADVSRTAYFREHRDASGIHEPLVLDFDRKLYGALGLIVQPTTVVIDRTGKLAHVIASRKSDYRETLAAYWRHALGVLDDAGLRAALEKSTFERDRPSDRIARHRAAAGLLRQNGLVADAETELRAALAIDATDVDTRLDLAALFVTSERVGEARAIVGSILGSHPSHRRANLLNGIVLYHDGDLAAADAALKKALLLNPDPELTHYYLGLIAERRGEDARAIAHFKEALERLLEGRAM